MSYTLKADPRRGGQSLQGEKSSLTEAIEAASGLLAGNDFVNVRIEGNGSTLTPPTILEIRQALHA